MADKLITYLAEAAFGLLLLWAVIALIMRLAGRPRAEDDPWRDYRDYDRF